ncbi:MAG: TolC family protein [Alistipes onderdonkii]
MSKGFSLGNDPYTTLSGAVDASVPLFAPQVYRMMKMNDKQMATAVEAARSSRITLTAEVKKAFYNILLAEQSLDVLRESEATVQRTVDDTQVQYQNGLTSEYDLLTAQVQLSNLKPSILQTENSIRIAKLMLKMYLSIPEQVEIEVEGELDAMRDKVLAGTEGLTTDTSDNSDLRTLELQEDLLRLQLKAENATPADHRAFGTPPHRKQHGLGVRSDAMTMTSVATAISGRTRFPPASASPCRSFRG